MVTDRRASVALVIRVRALEEQGLGTLAIAKALGVHRSTVSRYRTSRQKGSIPPLAQDKVEQIRQLRAEGLTTVEIAKRVGVTQPTVTKYGGASRNPGRWIEVGKKIAALEEAGISSRREQAKVLGIAHSALYRHFGPTKWGKVTTKDLRSIRQRFYQGESAVSLAKEFGTSRTTIYKVVRRQERYQYL